MTELFSSVTTCLNAVLELVTELISWGVQEPVILIGFTIGIAGGALSLFGSARGHLR
jgi:hypothetical protein